MTRASPEQLDYGPWTGRQKLWTLLAALAVIFDGFDIQILGFAIPSLIREWHVGRPAFGPVLALGLAGMAGGSPLAGYCGDRFGRRTALIGCVVLFGAATIATAFVNGIPELAVLRILTGMGAGGALPNASALAAEFAPLRRRALAVKLTVVCIPLGGMLGGLIASRVLPAFGWRTLYVIGGALPLLFAIVLWMAMPESPRFVARTAGERRRAPIRTLLGPGLGRDTAGLWLAFFFCLGSVYLVFGWLPAMLTAQGVDSPTATSGLAIYNFGGVLGVVVWSFLMAALGSRGPLLSGALAGAVSALLLLLIPIESRGDHTLLLAAIGLNGLLANAVQTSMYALAAHVYPAAVRASGLAYAAAIGRVGAIFSSLFGAYLIQGGPAAYWWTLAVAMVLACGGLAWVRSHFPAIPKANGVTKS